MKGSKLCLGSGAVLVILMFGHCAAIGFLSPDFQSCWETVCGNRCYSSNGIYTCSCNPNVRISMKGQSCRFKGTLRGRGFKDGMTCPVRSRICFRSYKTLEHIEDTQTTGGYDPERARNSLPDGLVIMTSRIVDAGLGVFTERDIPEGVVFGPYRGTRRSVSDHTNNSDYAWLIYKGGEPIFKIDAEDRTVSNWMRYCNTPFSKSEENLHAVQFAQGIYYRAKRPIQAGEELLVWYGDSYGQKLGLVVNRGTL